MTVEIETKNETEPETKNSSASKMATIQEVQQVNIQCECHHRHGPLFLLRPWAWGAPCRRCERMMSGNVVVVPSLQSTAAVGTAVTVTSSSSRRRRASPVVITTTTQAAPAPFAQQQQRAPQVGIVTPAQTASEWQAAQLPPRYEVSVAQ